MSSGAQAASFADMDPDIDNHDIVYGVVLPNLPKEHDSLYSRKAEYTEDEARQIDLAGLVMEANHDDEELPVGVTIAYRVQDDPNGGPASGEAVFKMNRESDDPNASDRLSLLAASQRNLMMSGYLTELSLGHVAKKYNVECDEYGRVNASRKTNDPAITYVKFHREVSTCKEGRRPGSKFKQYFPCARSLRRSTDDAIRSFARIYKYEAPPEDAVPGMKKWDAYLARLLDAIRARRKKVFRENNFTPILHARGFIAASADGNLPPTKSALGDRSADVSFVCPDDAYLTQIKASSDNNSVSN